MFKAIPTKPGELRRVTTISHLSPTYEVRLAALGEPLLFQTNRAELAAAAVDTFGRFPAPALDREPLVVQVLVRDGEGAVPAVPHPKLVVQNQRHLVYLSVGGSTAVADLQTGFAYAILDPSLAEDISFVRYAFIEALPQILLGGRDYVAVHAACVVKNGVSLMLCAPAGTGKSTLAFACLQHGYQILAEDVVQVRLADDAVQLWGIPWKFHLLPDALRFFPDLGEQRPLLQTNGEWKIEIDLDALYPGSTVTCAPAGQVIFLQRDHAAQPSLERLPLATARERFEVIWSWDVPWPCCYEQQLSSLLAQGAYRLRMNGLLDEAVRLLDTLL